MNASSIRIAVVVAGLFSVMGCAQNREVARIERENAALKEKVAALELQVAELNAARMPLTINGITLTGPEVGDMRWAAKPIRWGESVRALDGSNTYAAIGGGRLVSGTVGNLMVTSNETTWPFRITGIGTIEMGRPSQTGTPATTTTTTTTRSSTLPAPEKLPGNR